MSILPVHQPVTDAERQEAFEGRACIAVLARTVMDSITVMRNSPSSDDRMLAWFFASHALSAWKGPALPTVESLKRQVFDAAMAAKGEAA